MPDRFRHSDLMIASVAMRWITDVLYCCKKHTPPIGSINRIHGKESRQQYYQIVAIDRLN